MTTLAKVNSSVSSLQINQKRHAIEKEIYAANQKKREAIDLCPRLKFTEMSAPDKLGLLHVFVTSCTVETRSKKVRE